jgi:hypothetical protein
MAGVSRDTIRRVARTTEWFIVSQIAKEIPPSERFFLLYEMRGPRSTHPLILKARRDYAVGRCVDDYILVTVTRGQLEALLGMPEWFADHVDRGGELLANEARCIALSEDSPKPAVIKVAARAVNRPGAPIIVDR